MSRSRFAVAVFSFFLFSALPAAAQVYDTFVIPVVGNTAGAGGTRWGTQLSIFNPQQYTLKVSLTFLPTGIETGSEFLVTVPSNSTFFSSNVINDVFKRSGTGALLVATFANDNPSVPDGVIDRAFVVTTTTFNNASSGTFGQGIPGTLTGEMDFALEKVSSIATGIRNFGTIGSTGYRTNIGAVNTGRYSIRLLVSVYDSQGRTVADRLPFNVAPLAHFQDRLPVNVDGGTVEFFVDDPSQTAVVFPYASIVDNRSGDPVYVAPILLASPKYLYGNTKTMVAPTEVGKRIDPARAKEIAGSMHRGGYVHTENGAVVVDRLY
ncbi:MAG TPA: hypothetical protein VHL58_03015 [Thermoanaerobaculia bacterium]|nr:hypothetical protein [Thermoanaerobaculia bacterium]